MSFTINGRPIGAGQKPYIVAELSANHNGSIDRALQTIDAALACGADAIKIQTYTPDTMTLDCDNPEFIIQGGLWNGYRLYDLYKWAQTPFEWHQAIFAHARARGIAVFSTPFDETAVDLLESLNTPAYKIASFENTDLPLIQYVARTGKPIIMSTGMASIEEIGESVETARSAGCRELMLLHCISSYPAPIEQASLRQMCTLANKFNTEVGLSDHTLGTTAAVAAVALGASLIEKHFTLDRSDKGPDSEFSIEPNELAQLCAAAGDAWLALGDSLFSRQPAEAANKLFRRSIYFVRDLQAGAVVGPDDIRRVRPGNGLAPRHLAAVIGRRLRTSVQFGTPVSWSHFDD